MKESKPMQGNDLASQANGVEVQLPLPEIAKDVLTPAALDFIGDLARHFEARRRKLLLRRQQMQTDIDAGRLLNFLSETEEIRQSDWKIAPLPADLTDRRVEITGPVDRKMVINALNSGARVYMADFEDSHSPVWITTLEGQVNLQDAVKETITFTSDQGKHYQLGEKTATLVVRPRGWHMVEKHVQVDGVPISASLLDFGLFFFHNAQLLIDKGSGPYFYLPKMEHYLEARLWNDVFLRAQSRLGLPAGTIKATVLIETLPAAFQMDEILFELKDHMAGLNCGRWDYIFSFIKRFRNVPGYLFPDRAQITMTRHCMRSYSLLAIRTCHRRGALAIGGMAAQIPIRDNPEANRTALQKVREDKIREAEDGHDGTWVAHPGLVPVALEVFDRIMPQANQLHKLREDVQVTAADLLQLPSGTITEAGLRTNISVGIQYMAAWLNGNGCVPLYNLMEDAATAEISRTQVWQWVHDPHATLDDGRAVDQDLFEHLLDQEAAVIREAIGETQWHNAKYELAATLFREIVAANDLAEFLTLKAYDHL